MKKVVLLLTLVLASVIAGCGGDGSSFVPDAEQLAAAECSATSLSYLNIAFAEIMDFLSAIGGTLPPEVTYDDTTGDFSIASLLGTISGNVSSTDDISDGIGAGESVSATWDINPGIAGVVGVTGAGVFNVSRPTTNEFTILGNGQVDDTTCSLAVPQIDLDIDLLSQLGPQGSLAFSATGAFGIFAGTMSFDGSDLARVVASLNSVPLPTFWIDLNTFQPVF